MKHHTQPPPKADALQTCVDIFLTHQAAQRSTARTIANYRGLLGQFTTWLRARQIIEPRAITTNDVRAYIASLGERNLAGWYIHTHARTVKTWLRFLHAEGILPADIMARVAMPKLDRKILPSFTGNDVRKLLEACAHSQNPERDRAIILALLDSGVLGGGTVRLGRGRCGHDHGWRAYPAGQGAQGQNHPR